MASGDMLTKNFQSIFQIKPLLNIFFSINSKNSISYEGVFVFNPSLSKN
jgi:hypothetical protein